MLVDASIQDYVDPIFRGKYGVKCVDAKVTSQGSLYINMLVTSDPNAGPDAPEGYKNMEGSFMGDFIDTTIEPTWSAQRANMSRMHTKTAFQSFGVKFTDDPDAFIGKSAVVVCKPYLNKTTDEWQNSVSRYFPANDDGEGLE